MKLYKLSELNLEYFNV